MISVLQRPPVRGRIPVRTLRRRAQRLLTELGCPDADLAMVLCDDEEIRALNRDYREKDAATDVLSFAQAEGEAMPLPPGMIAPLGDIVISIQTAERQVIEGCLPRIREVLGNASVAERWTLPDEVTFLMLHGVLHLMGHDHMEPGEAKVMEAEEARLLPRLLRGRRRGA